MRTRRATAPQLEALEGRLALSTVTPAVPGTVQVETTKVPAFNGTLYFGFIGHGGPGGGGVFAFGGFDSVPFAPMGKKVRCFGELAHPQALAPGQLPDLSNSTLNLANAKGSVAILFSPSTTKSYHFAISAGTGQLSTLNGVTGSAVFSLGPHGYQIVFKSSRH
jgi:hypothetical protein